MIWRLRIGHWRFTLTFAQVTDVKGVNSNLPDGNHILMWDFDNIDKQLILGTLQYVKAAHNLSAIYLLSSGTPDHYIAYCFTSVTWEESKRIVADTNYVDSNFFKYGVYRDHWTLRVTPKEGRKPHLVKILHSKIPDNCCIADLKSWVQYETLTDKSPMRKRELTIAKKP